MRTRLKKDELLTPKAMGCFRLVYHGGGCFPPPTKISGPIAPRNVKLFMHVVFGLYFQNMSKKIQFHCLNGLNLALIFWPEFGLEKRLTFRRRYLRNPLADFFVTYIFRIYSSRRKF